MVSNIVKKISIMCCSTLAGLIFGGGTLTLVIAWMNYAAQDGPIFPPIFVALALVAPVMVILLLLDIGVTGYELVNKVDMGLELIVLGLLVGLGSGLLMNEFLISSIQDKLNLLWFFIFTSMGMGTGLTVFGVHWLGNRLWNYLDPQSENKQRRYAKP